MRSSLLPTGRDLANTAVSAALGVAAGALITAERRRQQAASEHRPVRRLPDDPAWHAAVAIGRVHPD